MATINKMTAGIVLAAAVGGAASGGCDNGPLFPRVAPGRLEEPAIG
jgi:hypothetical protein